MLFIKEITKKQWKMTAGQAKELAKELLYIAEEANDHQHEFHSQMIVDDGELGTKKIIRMVALPDKKEDEKR